MDQNQSDDSKDGNIESTDKNAFFLELLQKIQFDTSSDDAILKELVKHLQFGNISSLFDNLTEEEFEDDTDYSYEWRESD